MNSDRLRFRMWNVKDHKYHDDLQYYREGGFFHFRYGFPVEQCTGQKDEYGKLIYENDLVLVYNPLTDSRSLCVVEWSDDGCGWHCRYKEPDSVVRGCAEAGREGTYLDGKYCIVVGNIHEGCGFIEDFLKGDV